MSVKQEVIDFETPEATNRNGRVLQLIPITSPASHRFRYSNPLCLVNLNLLSEALWCNNCSLPLSLRSCLEEKAWRDSTLLKINCYRCSHEKCILLCNDDPDDDMYHDPESYSFGSSPAPPSYHPEVTSFRSHLDSSGNYVLEDTIQTRRPRRVTKSAGRSKRIQSQRKAQKKPGPKTSRKRRSQKGNDEEIPLVKRLKIKLPTSPNDGYASAFIDTAFSDEEDNKVDIRLNSPERSDSPLDNDAFNSGDDNDLNDSMDQMFITCLYCPKVLHKTLHAQHMKNDHPEVRTFFCEICSDEFTTIYFLRKHKMEIHMPKDSPKCETCGQTFASIESLKKHRQRHLPKEARSFKCSLCPKKFFEARRLKVHFMRFHQKCEGDFKCAHCPRGYESKRKLLRHIMEHVQDDIYAIQHGNEYARWKCEYCEKIFRNMGRQLVHMRECHPEFKAMICGWCGDKSNTMKAFQKHRRMNHRKDSLCVCDECGKSTLSPKKLALHKLSHRTDNEGKEFLCTYCPRAFAENSALVDHVKRFHVITTYYCEHCPKTFKMKFNIRRHMQLHTGVFRHSCPHCGANFVAADGRDHHIRNCHRFMCITCSSIFPTKDEVVVHRIRDHPNAERVREGDALFEKITDYNCEICFRYLSSKQALNTHLRTHTKHTKSEYNGTE